MIASTEEKEVLWNKVLREFPSDIMMRDLHFIRELIFALKKKEEGKNYHRLERYYGKFERSFRLNDDVDREKIEANFKNGVLSLSLSKTEKAQPKQIEVKVN